jgi:hypothetical protein
MILFEAGLSFLGLGIQPHLFGVNSLDVGIALNLVICPYRKALSKLSELSFRLPRPF